MDTTMTEKLSAGWLSVARVAEELGSTPLNVLMHIKRGLLHGEEIDGQWLVETRSLSKLLRRRLMEPLPAVCRTGCSKSHGCQSCG